MDFRALFHGTSLSYIETNTINILMFRHSGKQTTLGLQTLRCRRKWRG